MKKNHAISSLVTIIITVVILIFIANQFMFLFDNIANWINLFII